MIARLRLQITFIDAVGAHLTRGGDPLLRERGHLSRVAGADSLPTERPAPRVQSHGARYFSTTIMAPGRLDIGGNSFESFPSSLCNMNAAKAKNII